MVTRTTLAALAIGLVACSLIIFMIPRTIVTPHRPTIGLSRRPRALAGDLPPLSPSVPRAPKPPSRQRAGLRVRDEGPRSTGEHHLASWAQRTGNAPTIKALQSHCKFEPAQTPSSASVASSSAAAASPPFRFDVVITWVNGSLSPSAARCEDDMRFLLRSLERFGMWPHHVGTVWVLVSEHHFETCHRVGPPVFLNFSSSSSSSPSPRLRLVRHAEVFLEGRKNLPTDSRSAIVSASCRIPGT
jgi:hypothetical protein